MMKPDNYTVYHLHSMLSNGTTNIDSITNFRDYIAEAQKNSMKSIGFSEHGNIFEWLHKKEETEKAGMKYIHAIEAYLTEELYQHQEASIESDKKLIRDNYHCVLIAKNYDGVKEINSLVSKSYNRIDGHFYYMPRITFEELFNTSKNIIITTACLGGVLNGNSSSAKEQFIGFLKNNKDRCFLEIQHHNCQEQIEYNQKLYSLSKTIDVPLIAGTDTHVLTEQQLKGRKILQKAKKVNFANEDAWDITFKNIDELIDAYKLQNSLPIEICYEAIENTNVMSDMIEEFKIDYSAKYPKLYDDSEKVFREKINKGIKTRGIDKYPNYQEYKDRIWYEFDTYKHNNAIDFMLLEEDYKSEMRRQNIKFGYSRGSVSGSIIAYLLGITEVDSIKYNLNFERFMNKERVSLADVDTDWLSEDRNNVRDYLYRKDGLYCCDIVTFNTIALRGAIKDICRGLCKDNLDNLPDEIKQEMSDLSKKSSKKSKNDESVNLNVFTPELLDKLKKHSVHKEIPYDYLKFSDEVIIMAEADEDFARKKYPELFEYVDMVQNVIVSVGNHPAGCVVSPFPVDEWFGTFTTSTDKYPISVLNMKEIDSLNFVKLDILGLDNIGLIYKTCDALNIPFATPDNIPADDVNVWRSIIEDTTMIFQWESKSASAYLKQLMSDETISSIRKQNPNFSYMDLFSIGNGAIRPAGASYRDKLAKGIYQDNGHKALNDFLAPTLGYCVYQEQVIEFLHSFCGYTMGEADIVRRGFAKKIGTDKFIPKIKEGFIKTMLEKYDVQPEDSNVLIVNFIKVIEDASSYLFSKNHADPYSFIGYICGYLRYYYPLEFITTALNIFETDAEKTTEIINYAKKVGLSISPIKFRHSTAQYNYNKDTNEIFKGLASIKYLNGSVADEMYSLRDKKYDSFVSLLYDLKESTSINSRQLSILIELDFFEEFGDANYLRKVYELFDKFKTSKELSKATAESFGLDSGIIQKYIIKETEKKYKISDMPKLIAEQSKMITYKPQTLQDKINAQKDHLGYINIRDERYSGMGVVIEINAKYSPKLKIYSLKNGTTVDCKIDKKTFNMNKLKSGDIIRINGQRYKPKLMRNEDGSFSPVMGTKELWLTKYETITL